MNMPKDFTPEQKFLAETACLAVTPHYVTANMDAHEWRTWLQIAETIRAAVYVDPVEDMAKAMRVAALDGNTPTLTWEVMYEFDRDYYRRLARLAIARGAK